ncbi:MAG: Gfo/Idh/MocA family oxidoreductase [Bryobacteraceae bacterium]|nr:Gfo/Idh/MocA family oxidoreductase [Bryobacteraceae bacterium]
MNRKIRWGVIGVAKIGMEKVIPAMQRGTLTEVTAIASRDADKARQAALKLGIAKSYGSYEELLADPDVDAIYNPLPNQLHVPWSIRAAEAGKHVLCEKPISMDTAECRQLIAARDRCGVQIGEAFMARTHPQWLRARELAHSGVIGELRAMGGFFSYFNRDANNIRNRPESGGGGLMDIGCYPITLSRMIYGEEPRRVIGLVEQDPDFGVDRLTSAMLEYSTGQCIFNCSTQLVAYQRVQLLGTKGRIELEIPFNAPPDRPCRLFIDDGSSVFGTGIRTEEIATCDQYTVQGDLFSKAIMGEGPVPVPLEDALRNMAVITAILRSAETGCWENPASFLE